MPKQLWWGARVKILQKSIKISKDSIVVFSSFLFFSFDFSGLVHCSQVRHENIFLSLGLESW